MSGTCGAIDCHGRRHVNCAARSGAQRVQCGQVRAARQGRVGGGGAAGRGLAASAADRNQTFKLAPMQPTVDHTPGQIDPSPFGQSAGASEKLLNIGGLRRLSLPATSQPATPTPAMIQINRRI